MILFYFLTFFWLIRQIKSNLFWLYLWQIKTYRIDRFLDHFRTYKGKRIFLNKLFFLKIILLFTFIFYFFYYFYNLLIYILFLFSIIILYFFEFLKIIKDFFQGKIIIPVFTKKIIFLNLIILILEVFFIFFIFENFIFVIFWLLLFDILTPIIISTIVLIFQPLTIFLKRQIINKAKEKREKLKNLLVIGITGSYGKTSTKEFLSNILSTKFNILSTPLHLNTDPAIAQFILDKLNENFDIFIVEMAGYKKGEILSTCQFTKPKIGIITGINEQHLATFASMENLLSAEGGEELIKSLPEDGLVIFNGNNEYCQKIYQKTKIRKKIVFSQKNVVGEADLWAEEIKIEKRQIGFKIYAKDGESANFKVNLLGSQNVENILLAACCAKELGMNLKEISEICKKLKILPSQMELKKGINDLNIIDSSYSTNPQAVISHLEYLKIWSGKKVIIMPCLIELGKASKEIHKKIGKKIAEICDLAIITTKDNFKEIKENGGEKVIFLENPREVFEKIKNFNQEDDVILLEGRISDSIKKMLIL